MTFPVVFVPAPFGHEIAKLGAIVIGEIAPCLAEGRVKAWARLYLPDLPKCHLPATSMDKAKHILCAKVEVWLEAAELKHASPEF